jgi:hypothetical protein
MTVVLKNRAIAYEIFYQIPVQKTVKHSSSLRAYEAIQSPKHNVCPYLDCHAAENCPIYKLYERLAMTGTWA